MGAGRRCEQPRTGVANRSELRYPSELTEGEWALAASEI